MNTPVRLDPIVEKSVMEQIESILLKYADIIVPILIIIFIILTVLLVALLLKNVTAMDSGNYYYHLKDVI